MLLIYLQEYGYNSNQITNIITNQKLKTYQEKTLLTKIKMINNYLETIYKFKKIVIKITAFFPEIYDYSLETLKNKIANLIAFGYQEEDIFTIIKKFPNFLAYDLEKNIKPTFLNLMCLTYSKNQIIKMSITLPQLIGYSDKHIENHYQELIKLGYTFNQIFTISTRYPQIFSLSPKTIKNKFTKLQTLNLTLKEIIKITIISPQIYGYDFLKIQKSIELLVKYNYQKEEIVKIITSFPAIFDVSLINLNKKLALYEVIGFHNIIVNKPHNLIQSYQLSYARLYFFLDNNIVINNTNYQELFLSQEKFLKKYNYSNQYLLNKYSKNNSENSFKK